MTKLNKRIIEVLGHVVDLKQEKILSLDNTKDKDQIKELRFKISQFRKAIKSIEEYQKQLKSGNEALKLKFVGRGIAERIDEIICTDTLEELKELIKMRRDNVKVTDVKNLLKINGIGESHAKEYVFEHNLKNKEDLMQAHRDGKIKLTNAMLVGIKHYDDLQIRIPHAEISAMEQTLNKYLITINNKFDTKITLTICGSYRRGKITSGDMDVLLTEPELKTKDDVKRSGYLHEFVELLETKKFIIDNLTSTNSTKYMGLCRHKRNLPARRIDILFIAYESYYPAIMYFTGSYQFNIHMRTIALSKGLSLNEYGLYVHTQGWNGKNKGTQLEVNSENKLFDILGMKYLTPEERNDGGNWKIINKAY